MNNPLAHLKYRPHEYWEQKCRFGASAAWPVIDSLRKADALLEEFVDMLRNGSAYLEVPEAEELLERYNAMVAEGKREEDE